MSGDGSKIGPGTGSKQVNGGVSGQSNVTGSKNEPGTRLGQGNVTIHKHSDDVDILSSKLSSVCITDMKTKAVDSFNNNIKVGVNMLIKIYNDDLKDPSNEAIMKIIISKASENLSKEVSQDDKKRNIEAFIEHTKDKWDMFASNDPETLKEISPFIAYYVNQVKKNIDNPIVKVFPDMKDDFIKNLLEKKNVKGELCIKEASRITLMKLINRQIQWCKTYQGEC